MSRGSLCGLGGRGWHCCGDGAGNTKSARPPRRISKARPKKAGKQAEGARAPVPPPQHARCADLDALCPGVGAQENLRPAGGEDRGYVGVCECERKNSTTARTIGAGGQTQACDRATRACDMTCTNSQDCDEGARALRNARLTKRGHGSTTLLMWFSPSATVHEALPRRHCLWIRPQRHGTRESPCG